MNPGNLHLASYTENRDEDDLLAAYRIAQFMHVQALSLSAEHAPALESFLENLYSTLCLHGGYAAGPALECAADISRLSLVLRPAQMDARSGFLEARARGFATLFLDYEAKTLPLALDLLMDVIVLRKRLLVLAASEEEKHKQRTILASCLWRYWERSDKADLAVLRDEVMLRRQILQDHRITDVENTMACAILATSLYALYKSTGYLVLLDETLVLQRNLLRL
jgi:hypothetical protein